MSDYAVGTKVRLNPAIEKIIGAPEKYQSGIVAAIGYWGVIYVKWSGLDRPIGMKSYEIVRDDA